ncbi:CAAX prenyl protease 1 homolog [Scaptodrosophila lebanonensis]|uniref:CAAX prenyl protease 1 homolog n=1 Tax=Drosophila lebanonensis TaxID=7225 RepID=A0A6J2TT62_DROLE|nr:CAAX prenyl protease 1 homolog [Scaptodrosophila lebanonensis]
MGSLYQDPLQDIPLTESTATRIEMHMVPHRFTLTDPIMLRHVLCLSIIVHNSFHVFLCCRQLCLARKSTEPPMEMHKAMSPDIFKEARTTELKAVELQMVGYIIDAFFSCIELYFGIFYHLWITTMVWYRNIGDLIWHNIAFMALFSTYMTLRRLPVVFYNKFILEPRYHVDSKDGAPFIGIICVSAFMIVFAQVILIPLTGLFLFIEGNGGFFFVLWIWGFIFISSIIILIIFTIFGMPFIGKMERLPDGNLKNTLKDVLDQFHFPRDSVYIVRTSYSTNTSAYAWGFCYKKRVIVLDNLLMNRGKDVEHLDPDDVGKGLQDEQLVAFLVHELSHWYYYHFLKAFTMVQFTVLIYLMLFGVCYHQTSLYQAAGFQYDFYPHIVGYWLVFKYVMPPYLTFTNWIIYYFFRHFEYSADKHACRLGYGNTLSSALLKLFADNIVFPYVDKWYLMWYSRRPTCLQRLKHLQSLEIPADIKIHKSQFFSKI